ncbi:MAG TPA: hypothetical protein VK629_19965, partial [Steroidobacteraceae bacterium]|nr:hypothetical protein [Steroidobacteraceae bacterium]
MADVACASDIIPPKNYAVTPGGVNVADGSLQHSVADLSMGTIELQRFHRNGKVTTRPNDPPFGHNFSHNFDIYVATNPRAPSTNRYPIVHIGNRASGEYFKLSGSSSISQSNFDAWRGSLTLSGSQYTFVDNSDSAGTIYTFSATVQAAGNRVGMSESRRVERIDFADGRRQTISYNASGFLKLVEDTAGYAMVFDYNASGDVTAACVFNRSQFYVSSTSTCVGAAFKTSYTYSSSNFVVTDVMGQVTDYTMGNGGLTCIKPPGYSTCKLSVIGP